MPCLIWRMRTSCEHVMFLQLAEEIARHYSDIGLTISSALLQQSAKHHIARAWTIMLMQTPLESLASGMLHNCRMCLYMHVPLVLYCVCVVSMSGWGIFGCCPVVSLHCWQHRRR